MLVDFRNVKSLNIGGKNVRILRIGNRQIWTAVKPSYTGLKLQAEQDNVQVGLFAQGTAPQISIQYSMDEGQTWSDYTVGEYIDLPNMGDAVCWRSGSSGNGAFATNTSNYNYFKATGKIAAYGSVVSLLRQDYETNTDLTATYCFSSLFRNCTALTQAPDLPSTKLSQRCYSYMFASTSLTQAPELPATTLAVGCYQRMFTLCTSLTSAPDLPATKAESYCYNYMFNGCTSLTTAQESIAGQIDDTCTYCYAYMFNGCTSLTTAPDLPATTLAAYCYQSMFYNCKTLTTAPDLPATTLAPSCYYNMFSNCTSLNHVKIGYTGSFQTTNFNYWLNKVAEHGNLEYDGDDVAIGASAIPFGWTLNGQSLVGNWEYLKFTAAQANSTIKIGYTTYQSPKISLQYSDNGGSTWKTLTVGASGVTPTTVTLANVGDYIYVKATTTNDATSAGGYNKNNRFQMTGKISASGNVMSLLDGTRFGAMNTIQSGYCFYGLFNGCSALTSAPDLPATTLADYCYRDMFEGCTALTQAPDLPATTLATGCYSEMFVNCTSLNNIKIAYTGIFVGSYGSTYFSDWVKGVTSSGTLYYSGTDTTRGTSAIPENWTVLPYESRSA